MIRFELRKYWKIKKNLLFFVLVLLMNGVLFWMNIQKDEVYQGNYKQYYLKIEQKKQKLDWISMEQDKIDFYKNYTFLESGNNEFQSIYLQDTLDKYGERWVQEQSKIAEKQKQVDQEMYQYQQSALTRIRSELRVSQTYGSWKHEVIQQADSQNNISIFQKDTAQQNINKAIAEKYKNLNLQEIKAEPSAGIEKLLSYSPLDMFVLLCIVFLSMHTIVKEKENGYFAYTKSMSKGKKQQFFVKVGASSIIVSFCFLCMFLECFLITSITYGFVDLLAPVQSISMLSMTPYALNILQFLGLYVLIVAGTFCLFSLIATYVSYKSNTLALLLFVMVAVYGVSYFLYSEFSAVSKFPVLHTLNVYAILHPTQLLAGYDFYAFLGGIISHVYTILLLPLLVILFLFLGYRAYQSSSLQHKRKLLCFPSLFHGKPSSLGRQEFRKLMSKDKGWIAAMMVVIASLFFIVQEEDCTTNQDVYYNHFVETIGKDVSVKSDERLKKQITYYQNLEEELLQAKTDNQRNKLIHLLEPKSSFEMYKDTYILHKSQGDHREILKEDHYRMFFQDSAVTNDTYIFLMLCMMMLTVQSYHREKRFRMAQLQQCSVARREVHKWKVLHITILLSSLTLFVSIAEIIKIKTLYPNASFMMSINEMSSFFTSGISIPLWLYEALIIAARLIQMHALILAVSAVMRKWNQRTFVLLAGVLIMIVPVLLPDSFQALGINFMYQLFVPHTLLTQQYAYYGIGMILLLVVNIIFSIKLRKQKQRFMQQNKSKG